MDEQTRRWEGTVIHVEKKGDIIHSKKGILTETAILNRKVLSKRMRYLGNGMWETLDEPVEISNIRQVNASPANTLGR